VRTDVVIIGAGHSGLAMSRRLSERSIEHVILERGEVAHSWKTERWDSLRLLTPNWQSRLPGYRYQGPDPDGYMTVPEIIELIESYAEAVAAPVRAGTTVTSVRASGDGYRVRTKESEWRCRAVVLASGACNLAHVPALAEALPSSVLSLTPIRYRHPGPLPDGGVLVVGASATGTQIAEEIARTGRRVVLAVGEHVRLPRVYRGRDIQWWMDAAGLLDERYDEVDDIARARNVPSPQLTGSPERRTLDLNALTGLGVELVGRLAGMNGSKAQFSGSLRNVCELADLKMARLLGRIDQWIAAHGLETEVPPPERFPPTRVPASPRLAPDLERERIETVLWATGFRPDFHWLEAPVFDRKGRIRHDGGVVAAPGLYVLGLNFLRRRKSSFIHGAEDDTGDLADHLARYLDTASTAPPTRECGIV